MTALMHGPTRALLHGATRQRIVAATVAALAGAALLPAAAQAQAQPQSRIGTYTGWTAYTGSDAKGKVCYAALQPSQSDPKGLKRDPIYLLVSTRPSENVRNEPSLVMGYPFKPDSKVALDIDGQKFSMFTKEDGAWVDNPADEKKLIDAFRRGIKLTIRGTSRRGTDTTDAYVLQGASRALDAVAKACP